MSSNWQFNNGKWIFMLVVHKNWSGNQKYMDPFAGSSLVWVQKMKFPNGIKRDRCENCYVKFDFGNKKKSWFVFI